MRYANKDSIETFLTHIENTWNLRRSLYKFTPRGNQAKISMGSWFAGTGQSTDLESLKEFARSLYPHLPNVRLVMSGDLGYIYGNDLSVLKHLADLAPSKFVQFREVSVTLPNDRLIRRDPKHSFRSYFREIWISRAERDRVSHWLEHQPGIKISNSIRDFFKKHSNSDKNCYLRNYFFVDHDDPGLPLMLELLKPRILRVTLPIERINN